MIYAPPPTHVSTDQRDAKSGRSRLGPSSRRGRSGREMNLFLLHAELDRRTAWLLAGGACACACAAGALVGVLRSVHRRREATAKVRRARARRDESLHRAEEAVLQYKESVRAALPPGRAQLCCLSQASSFSGILGRSLVTCIGVKLSLE